MALDFSTYPPKGHQERIAAYLRFEKLFLGQHKDLYLASPGRYQMVRYIVANFAGLISRLAADLPGLWTASAPLTKSDLEAAKHPRAQY